ncbi:MAG: EamA family transporter [Solirubrobacteraceae bacterium]
MLAISLALGASLCWGISDFAGGMQARRLALALVLLATQGIALVVLCATVALAGRAAPDLGSLVPAAAAGVSGVVALGAFYRALAIGTMSIVAPISASGAAVPVIVGIVSGDRPSPVQIAGIVTTLAGVVLASRERDESPRRHVARASILLALVAAAGFGGFFVGIRASARVDVAWTLVAARAASVAMLVLVVAVRPGLLRAGPQRGTALSARGVAPSPRGAAAPSPRGAALSARDLAVLAMVGLLDLGANGLYAIATRHGLLSEVAVASSLYPVVTVLLARLVLRERAARVQELGIVAAIAGVAMLAAG